MITSKSFLKAHVFGLLLTLVACAGQQNPPIAFKMVNARLNESASFQTQDVQDQALSNTLLESVIKQGVPEKVATSGFAKYDQFQSLVKNPTYISLIDFTQFSGKPRFYMINTTTGAVDTLLVAHGSGSDPTNSGTPSKFSNVPNSKMSSLGAYLVSEETQSPVHGTVARLDGLESTNNLARPRAIILHSATYVTTARSKMGMSWGCPAIPLDWISTALARLHGGSFMFAFGPPQSTAVDEQIIQQIMINPAYHWIDESLAPPEGEPST